MLVVAAVAAAQEVPGHPSAGVGTVLHAATAGLQGMASVERIDAPSFILHDGGTLYVSLFWKNVVVAVDPGQPDAPPRVVAQGYGLDGPWGLAVVGGELLVASFGTDVVHRYRLDSGRFVGAFGGEDVLDCPEGIAVAPGGGALLVVSFLSDEVKAFALPDGEYLGVAAGSPLRGPEGVAALATGELAVTSHDGDAVHAFGGRGRHLGRILRVDRPVGIAAGPDGAVYVASYREDAIVRVDRDGNSRVFMQDARFGGPSSLAFGSDSLLAVASYEHSRIVLVNVSTLERRVLRRY